MNVTNPSDDELRELLYRFKETPYDSPYAPIPRFEAIRLTDEQIGEALNPCGLAYFRLTQGHDNLAEYVRRVAKKLEG